MKRRKKLGRPPLPKSVRRSEPLQVSFTPREFAAVKRAAKRSDLGPFARTIVLKAIGYKQLTH